MTETFARRTGLVSVLVLTCTPVGAAQFRTRSGEVPAAVPTRRVVLEGFVLGPDASAEGAVVASSAGGRALCDPEGRYRFEVDLPLAAERLQVTAIARGAGGVRSASVLVESTSVLVTPEPLVLGAQVCAPDWIPTFGAPPGPDQEVEALAVFDDGSGPALYVGGGFRGVAGMPVNGLVRWDGTAWSVVGGGLAATFGNPFVLALEVLDDGTGPALYVGGNFTSAGGIPANALARWDGTTWSALGSGWSLVYDFAVFDDGGGPALHAAGTFSGASRVARWDGATWSALGSPANASILELCPFDDGGGPGLYAGGQFTSLGGASWIARWDGTAWTSLGAGVNAPVHSMAVLAEEGGPALVVGGQFTTAGGLPASRIARWDGTAWSPLGGGTTNTVLGLLVTDGPGPPALYATGRFRFAGGVQVEGITRWDGQGWQALGTGLSYIGQALTVYDDGNGPALHVGGVFQEAGGVPAIRLARWDGLSWSALGCGERWVDGRVSSVTTFDAGSGPELIAGGSFSSADGVNANRIARWDGTGWAPLGQGVESDVSGFPFPEVHDLAVFDDGSGPALYAAGSFTLAGGAPALNVARWDGTTWSPLGGGLNNRVWALAVFDDGAGPALYAGGHFTDAGGVPVNRIARWDGVSWAALGAGVNGSVTSLGVFDDGNGPALYVGGSFTSAGGAPASRIARWDGTSWAALGSGLDGGAWAFQAFDDGGGNALYVGGVFTNAGGAPANRVARWDGAAWSALGSGTDDTVYGLAVLDTGNGPELFAGGSFTVAGGVAASRVARWDGAGWSALGAGPSDFLDCLAVLDDGAGPALYAGGVFASSSSGDAYLARWGCVTSSDTTPPTLVVPPSRTVLDRIGSPPGEYVTFVVRACDETDPAPVLVCSPPSGSLFPRGTTLVTCTATDASGNVAMQAFPVTVAPKARPR